MRSPRNIEQITSLRLPVLATWFVTACLGAAACKKEAETAAIRPPAVEFLLAAGDSTYWVRSGPDGVSVRSAPILLTLVAGHFYELFIADDVHEFDDATFANAKAFSRDITRSDSLLILADHRVQRETALWQHAHPRALPLDPEHDDAGDLPPTIVSDDIQVVDVHGPYLSYEYSLDVDVAGRTRHQHEKRRGVLDLRSGSPASPGTLFGESEAQRVQADAQKAFANLQDSIRHTTDARGTVARPTLASFVFDSMNFGIMSSTREPALAYLVSGTSIKGEPLSLYLPPIAAAAPVWWSQVQPTLPQWNSDSTLVGWARTDYSITATPNVEGDVLAIVLHGQDKAGVAHSWPVTTVTSPVYSLISLDAALVDDEMRGALAHAFDHSRALGRLAHQARRTLAKPVRKFHSTTFRACPFQPRSGAMPTRQFASRTFDVTSSACSH